MLKYDLIMILVNHDKTANSHCSDSE